MTYEDALNIFTDGSSFQKPRRGGIGIRFITYDSNGIEFIQDVYFCGYMGATNNQMELQACIMALKEAIRLEMLNSVSWVVIFTDSLYIADNYKRAMFEWSGNKWFKKTSEPVLNADLWKELIKLIKRINMRIEFKWVKGHSKDINNRTVDRMARQSANLPINKPISIVQVRRKISQQMVDPGCVEIKGQRISIRIITSEFLKVQKLHKYKYEVISKKSDLLGYVDIIYSDLFLKVGHSFFVVLNKDPDNPRIVKVIKEL